MEKSKPGTHAGVPPDMGDAGDVRARSGRGLIQRVLKEEITELLGPPALAAAGADGPCAGLSQRLRRAGGDWR